MSKIEYSLRETKHARTKLALMNACLARLRHSRFDDISIRDVCRDAEISEGTFFNYFPAKLDIITYYVNLTTMKLRLQAQKKTPRGQYIPLLTAFFNAMADECAKLDITYELISIMVVQHTKPKSGFISDVEKRLFFPNLAGIETVAPRMIEEFMRESLASALKNRELPGNTDIDDALVSLLTIMIGTMIAIKFSRVKNIKYQYMRQLRILWTELGVKQQKG